MVYKNKFLIRSLFTYPVLQQTYNECQQYSKPLKHFFKTSIKPTTFTHSESFLFVGEIMYVPLYP